MRKLKEHYSELTDICQDIINNHDNLSDVDKVRLVTKVECYSRFVTDLRFENGGFKILLRDFLEDLRDRGVVSMSPEDVDYDRMIWEFLNDRC